MKENKPLKCLLITKEKGKINILEKTIEGDYINIAQSIAIYRNDKGELSQFINYDIKP